MSRRTGKAATRRARQQKRAKQGPAPSAPSSPPVASDDPPEVASTEVASIEATTTEATAAKAAGPRRAALYAGVGASSRLGNEAEYHYVVSDLRNTGVLVLVMAVLLAVSVVIVNVISAAP